MLVTNALPKEIQRYGIIDGVWICSFNDVRELSLVLRYGLLKLQQVAVTNVGKDTKMEMLYKYLTSEEFKNLFESIITGFKSIQDSHHNEKLKMQRLWKEREKVLEQILSNSVEFYGSLKGIAGASIQDIQLLEVDSQLKQASWYKYARLMKIKRRRQRKFKVKYNEGIRASSPNEKWHADITEIQTADGKTAFIYLVVDNFSRYITSWRVYHKICARVRIDTFGETIINADLKPKAVTQLIVDGGTENNNKKVHTFLDKYPVEKVIALKDILKSNSP